MTRARRPLIALLLLLGSGGVFAVTEGSGRVAGVVVDERHEAVAGARVSLARERAAAEAGDADRDRDAVDGGAEVSAVTDRQGRFSIAGLPPGRWSLTVAFQGERFPQPERLAIETGGSIRLVLNIRPSHPRLLEEVLVTAERAPAAPRDIPETIDVLRRADLDRFPAADLTGVLRRIPGLDLYDAGGSEADPSINVRGFTGGGENDYLLVLVDGVRINDFGNGRVDWREVPLADLDRVEIVRGPASALYGDAAVGGVVQMFTREPDGEEISARTGAGSDASRQVSARYARSGDAGWYKAALDFDAGQGWRDRDAFEDLRGGFHFGGGSGTRRWRADLWLRSDEHEIPGPLPGDLFETAPRSSVNPFDTSHRRRGVATLQESLRVSAWTLDAQAALRAQDDVSIETLLGEAKQRRFDGVQVSLETRARRAFGRDARHELLLGLEAFSGRFGSRYFDVDAQGRPAGATADGDGRRGGLGVYVQTALQPAARVRLLVGVRGDWIRDRFDEHIVPDVSAAASHGAIAPRAGVIWSPGSKTELYANLSRTFKDPTPSQLFDQRRPFGVPVTNPDLAAQTGRNVGAGVRRALGRHTHASLAAYRIDLENEIGFDPAAFRLDNIGRSRHRGIEASLDAVFPSWSATFGYTISDARFESGEFAGNRIDNVPRRTGSLGLSWKHGTWETSVFVRDIRDTFLDPGETRRLPDYRTLDLGVSKQMSAFEIRLDLRNAFDAAYATWGFVSPLDGSALYYPGAGRTWGVSIGYRSGARH